MAHKIIATVKFKDGTISVLKQRFTHKRKDIETGSMNMREVLQQAYKEQIPAQLTIGTTVINVLDTSSIDLRIKWCF